MLDSGATHTSAIPVYDGYCITQAIVRSPLGGDAITTWCKQFLDEQGVEVVPSYMIQSKETVGERDKAVWTRKPNLPEVTKSYHDAMTKVFVTLESSVHFFSFPIFVGSYSRLSGIGTASVRHSVRCRVI